MDVVGVALQPGGVEQDVLAALLHRALGRRRRVAVEETLRAERGEREKEREEKVDVMKLFTCSFLSQQSFIRLIDRKLFCIHCVVQVSCHPSTSSVKHSDRQ